MPARDGPDDPTDALSVLADETRLAILRTLADADEPLTFSRLRDRAGVEDSGRFSYHLRQLCEYFVRDTGEGYELGHAGSRLIDATAAGEGPPAHGAAPADGGQPARGQGDERADPLLDELEECPVCGDPDCDRFVGVHLSPPWA